MEVGSIWNHGGLLCNLLGRELWKKKRPWGKTQKAHSQRWAEEEKSVIVNWGGGEKVGRRVGGMAGGQEKDSFPGGPSRVSPVGFGKVTSDLARTFQSYGE